MGTYETNAFDYMVAYLLRKKLDGHYDLSETKKSDGKCAQTRCNFVNDIQVLSHRGQRSSSVLRVKNLRNSSEIRRVSYDVK